MLKVGTILRGIYRIDSYLSSGGFGNTYVATNVEFEERVAIKEFFMKGVTQRDDNQTTVSVSNTENSNSFLEQREKFKKEARRIRQLNNPHIVRVHDLFEENGTAYYVMDYVDGENLSDRLKRTGKPMTEDEVSKILPQILDALKSIHDAGIWHLDLKPANIMVDKSGNVKLIDFGASKQLNAQKGGATTSTAISYTNGYAPREQMEQNYDKFGPWTDMYALGATLYNLLTNKRPPLPTDIDDDISADKHEALPFPESVSAEMKSLVLMMLKTNRLNRPQSVNDIIAEKIKKESPLQNPKHQPITQGRTVYDIEETIIATPKSEETIIEKKPQTEEKAEQKVDSQIVEINTSTTDNGNSTVWKIVGTIVIGIIAVIIINYGGIGCNNTTVENAVPVDSIVESVMNKVVNKKVVYDDGSSYDGEWLNQNFDGHGIYIWPNGQRFEGEWKKGIRIKGTYTWPEKRTGYMYKYVGEFNKEGNFDGKGTAYYVGGATDSGVWKNGEFVGSEKDIDLTPLEQKVVGKHPLSLQWISWDYFGICEITKDSNGKYRCIGSQYSKENSDYLKLDGYISIINEKHLKFTGTIKTRIQDQNNGNEYVREGTFDFKATGGRKYWREQEMAGSEYAAGSRYTDYIDIYFQKK